MVRGRALATATGGAFLFALLGVSCQGSTLDLGNDEPPPVALAGACVSTSETQATFTSDAALASALRGRWFRCRGVSEGVLAIAGLEFADDDAWYGLIDDGTGKFVRSSDPAQRGTWTTKAPLTVGFAFANRATQTLVVLFSAERAHFNVVRTTFDLADVGYVRQ